MVLLRLFPVFAVVHGRVIVPLDGTDWLFTTDTAQSNTTAPQPPPWIDTFLGAHSTDTARIEPPPWEQHGKITVPGCWSSPTATSMLPSTAYGNATATRSHHYIGLGWYIKQTPLQCARGLTPWLSVDHGMHRRAHAFVRSGPLQPWVLLFDHTGYLDRAEAPIAPSSVGQGVDLAIGIDATVHSSTDPLMGAADLDTDGTDLGGWGGLNGHVSLECRPPLWIAQTPHVTHEPVTVANEGRSVTTSVSVNITSVGALPLHTTNVTVEIFDVSTNASVGLSSVSTAAPGVVVCNTTVPTAHLWDPETPHLYVATVSLRYVNGGIDFADSVSTRFGLRTISRDGYRFLINGRPLFLPGYGDDSVYPTTVAPPRAKSEYLRKLEFAHQHNFRFVRHHSHVLPDEYFDASDEVGVMISPELPCVYHNYYDMAGPVGLAEYARTWAAYIARLRNHPSIFDWAMCNEYASGIKQGPEFYAVAKALDPTRLVIDADGLFGWSPTDEEYLRPTLDFHSVQFDVKHLPLTNPTKFDFNATPQRPVISHETGNYNTFPRLMRLINGFARVNSSILPYWLTPSVTKLSSGGLLSENDLWSNCSEKLYRLCWKNNIEGIRKNEKISGYEWWLLVDYWGGNNGLTDSFEEPKSIAESISGFHSNVVLLEDGLDVAYKSGDSLKVALSVSNFGSCIYSVGTAVAWNLTSNGKSWAGVVPLGELAPVGSLTRVGNITVSLPGIGTTRDAEPSPTALTLSVVLKTCGGVPGAEVRNEWTTTLYPSFEDGPSPPAWNVTIESMALGPACMFDNCVVIPDGVPPASLVQSRVHLTTTFQDRYLQIAQAGGVVVLVPNGTECFYPTDSTSYKQAWWVGNARDNNAGSVVYDAAQTVLGPEIAPEGWADWTWWRMIEGAQTFILDDFGENEHPSVLVRAIDIVTLSRNKALLFQMKVGKGYVIGVGLNVIQNCERTKGGGADCPMIEKAWVFDRILRHAGSLLPSSALAVSG